MLHCYINRGRDYVASINKQSPAADAYSVSLPWLLLLVDGRVRRFPSLAEARDEAQKRFAPVVFRRSSTLRPDTMLHCYINRGRDYVASINKQSPAADAYSVSLPWLLLLVDGRVRRFPSLAEARDEAQKRFAPVVFRRS